MHGELIGREALAQLALQQAGAPRDQVHLRRKEATAVTAVGLGAVHRQLRVLEQPVRVLAVRSETSVMPMLALVCTSSPLASNGWPKLSISRRASARGSSGPRTPDCRIANSSPPSRAIAPASSHAALQPRGDRAQQQIAAGQAERVVHALEAIEIEQEHGGLRLAAPGARQGMLEKILEQGAIGQPGQRIVARLMAYLRPRLA